MRTISLSFLKKTPILTAVLALMTSFGYVSVATAQANPISASATATSSSTPTPSASANSSPTTQATLTMIISRGNTEINRRLTSLGKLTDKVSSTTKLTASDKTSLSGQVTSEVSGLTALKTKLDAETTAAGARTDAQSIFNDYRVYALILPKVYLVKAADDQQVSEAKLSALATKLQTRLTASPNANASATLSDMQFKINVSTTISSTIESGVIALQPTDYDSNHTVLSGDLTQLKTAQTDNQVAAADAKTIISEIK